MSNLTIPIDDLVQALAARPEIADAIKAEVRELMTLSHGEAARALGIGRDLFRIITESPAGPKSIMVGAYPRWRLRDLTAWLASLEEGRAKQIGMGTRGYNKLKSKPVEQVQPPSGYQTFGRKPKAPVGDQE